MKYLGVVLLVLSGYVMAEEAYVCSDKDAMGFNEQEGKYKPTMLTLNKFKMKIRDDGNMVIDDYATDRVSNSYICSTPFSTIPHMKLNHRKSCVEEFHNGYQFNFNLNNGRYTWSRGAGYVFHDRDTAAIQIGTCTKF